MGIQNGNLCFPAPSPSNDRSGTAHRTSSISIYKHTLKKDEGLYQTCYPVMPKAPLLCTLHKYTNLDVVIISNQCLIELSKT